MEPTPPSADSPPKRRDGLRIILFFFLLGGLIGLVPIAWQAKLDYRIARVYEETTCVIMEFIPITTGIFETRPGKRRDIATRPMFLFRFSTATGEEVTTRGYDNHGGREAPPEEYRLIKVGQSHPCWYDPANPKKAVLFRSFNPHYYWVLVLPVGIIGFSGLLLRESFRAGGEPRLKGVEPGRQLAWRLPPSASQQGMTGCMGVAVLLFGMVTAAMWMAATDYTDPVYRYRWISRVLGFNFNGWWVIMVVFAAVTALFIWAFFVNLRWIGIPEAVVEVNDLRLAPGQSTRLRVIQAGPIKASSMTVSLVCQVNGAKGITFPVKEKLIVREPLVVAGGEQWDTAEMSGEIAIPTSARLSRKSANPEVAMGSSQPGGSRRITSDGDLVSWFLRVERQVSAKMRLETDYEIVVARATD